MPTGSWMTWKTAPAARGNCPDIASSLYPTPPFDGLPETAVESLKEQVVVPKRLGMPAEYAKRTGHIVENA